VNISSTPRNTERKNVKKAELKANLLCREDLGCQTEIDGEAKEEKCFDTKCMERKTKKEKNTNSE
jgi:hypothetical protein